MKINTLGFALRVSLKVKRLFIALALLTATITTHAQNVTILPSGITPLPIGYYPRLTYDAILALPSPQIGDLAVDLTFRCLRFYTGDRWARLINDDDLNLPAITAWAEGGTDTDYGYSIAVDPNGYIYVCGKFRGTATFETTNITSSGSDDVFIAKYSKAGVLQWVRRAGGTSSDYANGICVDASGNTYITGAFSETATFDATNLTSSGSFDIFLARYNTNGVLQWVQQAGGTGYDIGNSVSLDGSGNAYLTGSIFYTAAFGDTTVTSAGNADIFIAKYNSAGQKQWVRNAGSATDDIGNAIAADASGNVYATGYFQGTATFSGTPLVTNGNSDVFLVKYDTNGALQWVRKGGSSLTDSGNGITVSNAGEIFVTGNFAGTANFGGTNVTSAGDFDIFIAKYNLNGDFIWVRQAGGTGVDEGNGIVRDTDGNIYVTGYFINTATFGDVKLTSLGNIDIFIAKYNIDGVLMWVQKAGTPNAEMSTGIAIDTYKNVYITGYFGGSATFGNTTITSAGSLDVFIARIKE